MKRLAALVLLVVLFVAGYAWHVQAWHNAAMWFNYDAIGDGFVVVTLPHDSARRATLFAIQLPGCGGTAAENWKAGEWGRIAIRDGVCRVQRRTAWGETESAEHYRRLAIKLAERGSLR